MNNNQSPSDFVASLPIASTVPHEIASGDTPLPPTALLSEVERLRLDKLAASGEQPIERSREEQITTFEDGSCVKHCARPGSDTQRIIVEATGRQLAIAKDENIAEWICNACNLMVLASLKAEADGVPLQIFHKPIELPGS